VAGAVTKEMVASMAERPIVFALANPDPEITPEEVLEVRPDAIMATGRTTTRTRSTTSSASPSSSAARWTCARGRSTTR
jgi:malic enzyme